MAVRCKGERQEALVRRFDLSGGWRICGWGDVGAFPNFGPNLGEGVVYVRLVLILVVLVIASLAGLYIYGQMLEPETRTIEQEALDASS